MKKTIVIVLSCLLFIYLAGFVIVRINTIYAYLNFRHLGVDVKKIGFYIEDDRVSAEINIEKDNKLYTIVFRRVNRKNFFNESLVVIESINGYGTLRCVCTPPEVFHRVFNEDNKPVGSTVISNLISINSNSFFYEFFEVEESSIAWIINNIDKIEEKFMQISTDYYSYYKAETGEEIYFKRKKVDDDFKDFYRQISQDKALNDTVFVFENSDCNRFRL